MLSDDGRNESQSREYRVDLHSVGESGENLRGNGFGLQDFR
jgi:hypothetical protein